VSHAGRALFAEDDSVEVVLVQDSNRSGELRLQEPCDGRLSRARVATKNDQHSEHPSYAYRARSAIHYRVASISTWSIHS